MSGKNMDNPLSIFFLRSNTCNVIEELLYREVEDLKEEIKELSEEKELLSILSDEDEEYLNHLKYLLKRAETAYNNYISANSNKIGLN